MTHLTVELWTRSFSKFQLKLVLIWCSLIIHHHRFVIKAVLLFYKKEHECPSMSIPCDRPGEAHAPAVATVVSKDPRGDDLSEGLQHVLQLFLIHWERQVGNVQICGVLLLLLLTMEGRQKRRVYWMLKCMNQANVCWATDKCSTDRTRCIFLYYETCLCG